ncbi:MAG: hypothetical protein HQK49_07775 [Oligoflexia bacterium]|nr:hypothetical protein [Oligoflexia bacterium]
MPVFKSLNRKGKKTQIFFLFYTFIVSIFIIESAWSWVPDLKSNEGIMQFIVSIYRCYPENLTRGTGKFPHDFLTTYKSRVIEVMNRLDKAEWLADTNVGTSKAMSISYIHGNSDYDQEKFKEVKSQLLKDFMFLNKQNIKLESCNPKKNDLLNISKNKEKDKDTIISVCLRLFPLIDFFKDKNMPIDTNDRVLDDLRQEDLKTHYMRNKVWVWNELPENIVKDNKIGSLINKVRREFGERSVQSALTRFNFKTDKTLDKSHPIEVRTISIEELPPIMTPLRGHFGGDCSSSSVHSYGLIKGSKVFLIKEDDSKNSIRGYVFVAEARTKNSSTDVTIPYIISINGASLTKEDTQNIVKMIGDFYGTKELLVPDFNGEREHLVNSDEIKDGLTFTTNSSKIDINLPQGWSIVSDWIDKNKAPQGENSQLTYENYYQTERISKANLLNLDDMKLETSVLEKKISGSGKVCPQISYEEIKKMDKMEKQKFLASFIDDEKIINSKDGGLRNLNKNERRDICNILGISLEELNATKILYNLNNDNIMGMWQTEIKPLSVQDVLNIKKNLNLSLPEIFKIRTKAEKTSILESTCMKTLESIINTSNLSNLSDKEFPISKEELQRITDEIYDIVDKEQKDVDKKIYSLDVLAQDADDKKNSCDRKVYFARRNLLQIPPVSFNQIKRWENNLMLFLQCTTGPIFGSQIYLHEILATSILSKNDKLSEKTIERMLPMVSISAYGIYEDHANKLRKTQYKDVLSNAKMFQKEIKKDYSILQKMFMANQEIWKNHLKYDSDYRQQEERALVFATLASRSKDFCLVNEAWKNILLLKQPVNYMNFGQQTAVISSQQFEKEYNNCRYHLIESIKNIIKAISSDNKDTIVCQQNGKINSFTPSIKKSDLTKLLREIFTTYKDILDKDNQLKLLNSFSDDKKNCVSDANIGVNGKDGLSPNLLQVLTILNHCF